MPGIHLHGPSAQNPVRQARRSHPSSAPAGPDYGHVPVRPARPRFRQSQHPLLHPHMVRPDGGGRVGGAGQQQTFTSSLLYLYVLGHELTHVLAVFCSRGSIHAFKADLDGGYIQTDKNNLFISLSPYFLPLWAMLWGLVWGMAYLFWPTVTCQALLYSGLGFWWCFHLFWTAWIIPKDQPDLADNGTFFSLILVYFANLLLFLVLLRLVQRRKPAPLFDGLRPQCGKAVGRPAGTSSCWRPALFL